jgi:excisionase family DNA binding protein
MEKVLSRATYNVEEVATLLGVNPRTVYNAIARGEIAPTSRIGTRILIPRWVVDRMLALEARQ